MASLTAIPEVDIEANGICKYILLKLTAPNEERYLVRGYAQCNYHADVNDLVEEEVKKLVKAGQIPESKTKVEGGGRIVHDSPNRNIKVYGYSQAYGQADHAKTVELLKKVYPDYEISWSDEGY